MKTLLSTALIAFAALTAPAFAGQVPQGSAAAIAHFNQSKVVGDRSVPRDAGAPTERSTRSATSDAAFARFNGDADTQDGRRGLNGTTRYSGAPSFGRTGDR